MVQARNYMLSSAEPPTRHSPDARGALALARELEGGMRSDIPGKGTGDALGKEWWHEDEARSRRQSAC